MIKVTKGRAEYDAIEWEPSVKFINIDGHSQVDYQHIIKNDNNPKNFTVEMFDGIIGKS